MARIGIRKGVEKALNTKVGKKTDKVMNFLHRKPGDIINVIGERTGLNKLKITVNGQNERKHATAVIHEKTKTANRNLIKQETSDLAESKLFEAEKAEGLKYMAAQGVKPGDKINESIL